MPIAQGTVDTEMDPITYNELVDAINNLTAGISPDGVDTFTDGDTTPSVSGNDSFKTGNTAPTTITDFDDGTEGQEIRIEFCDTDTTIKASASIVLQGGQTSPDQDFGPSAVYDILKLYYNGTRWVEVSRSLNS